MSSSLKGLPAVFRELKPFDGHTWAHRPQSRDLASKKMSPTMMQPHHVYEHLENLAGQLGIFIRYENLSDSDAPTRSGLCMVQGRHLYIMDSSTTLSERIRLLSSCLSRMDLEGRYVLPAIRKLLETARRREPNDGCRGARLEAHE
jgi:hypothetical protein